MSSPTQNKSRPAPELLTTSERVVAGAVAFTCLCLAMCAALFPASLEMTELGANGVLAKQTWTQTPRTELALFLATVGLLIICFVINGLRLTKLTIGSTSVETHKPAVEAAEDFAKQNPGAISQVSEAIDGSAPGPDMPISRETKTLAGDSYYIYETDEIPFKVIGAVFEQWNTAFSAENPPPALPANLSSVQFAARKSGKGNFPWLIAFQDAPPVRVSLGGQGKAGPTVTAITHSAIAETRGA